MYILLSSCQISFFLMFSMDIPYMGFWQTVNMTSYGFLSTITFLPPPELPWPYWLLPWLVLSLLIYMYGHFFVGVQLCHTVSGPFSGNEFNSWNPHQPFRFLFVTRISKPFIIFIPPKKWSYLVSVCNNYKYKHVFEVCDWNKIKCHRFTCTVNGLYHGKSKHSTIALDAELNLQF